jgi:hypothetical protein
MTEGKKPPLWTQNTPFTDDQILQLLDDRTTEGLTGSQMKGHAQFIARFALEGIWAVRRFERTSGRLTCALIVLTAILMILTVVLTYFTIVLATKC